MKTSDKVLNIFSIVAALVIGFLIGLVIEYPKVDKSSVSGTIAKINNYRNTQNSTSDIEIQNELVTDTARLKSVQNYLNFFYVTAAKMAGDIQFAVKEANAIDAFKTSYQSQITNLNNYEKYLSSARTDLLLAISVCKNPKETDPLLLKDLLNQVNNVIAQVNYKNRIVLDFMEAISTYADANKDDDIQNLKAAHDLLTLNEVNIAKVTRDRPLLKSLVKKDLLSDGKELKKIDQQIMNKMILQDIDKLGRAFDSEKPGFDDVEKLGYVDSEKLSLKDVEKLCNDIILDAEKLGYIALDVEKLGFSNDADKLSALNDSEMLSDLCTPFCGLGN